MYESSRLLHIEPSPVTSRDRAKERLRTESARDGAAPGSVECLKDIRYCFVDVVVAVLVEEVAEEYAHEVRRGPPHVPVSGGLPRRTQSMGRRPAVASPRVQASPQGRSTPPTRGCRRPQRRRSSGSPRRPSRTAAGSRGCGSRTRRRRSRCGQLRATRRSTATTSSTDIEIGPGSGPVVGIVTHRSTRPPACAQAYPSAAPSSDSKRTPCSGIENTGRSGNMPVNCDRTSRMAQSGLTSRRRKERFGAQHTRTRTCAVDDAAVVESQPLPEVIGRWSGVARRRAHVTIRSPQLTIVPTTTVTTALTAALTATVFMFTIVVGGGRSPRHLRPGWG
ncbi:MAG: hypothetical protein QOK43_2996 [Acidimicrobiaceae bacterium]|nr:hypothetical protein [Acidimicrobiaceae bacterium]